MLLNRWLKVLFIFKEETLEGWLGIRTIETLLYMQLIINY